VLAEIALDAESPVPIGSDLRELAVLSLAGEVRVNDELVAAGQLAVLRPEIATTLSGAGTAVVLGGDPVGKRHIWWNFVHSEPERIEEAKADWIAQRFSRVPNDHEPHVPLPR
jgi:redox-sensitive bicupin YhaK (pirin superfamily)